MGSSSGGGGGRAGGGGGGAGGGGGLATLLAAAPKMSRALKSKANGSGRQYTSKFRGVHQTFPTKRWEAQFRRNGKPTSLGKWRTLACSGYLHRLWSSSHHM
jgi:hypothetical protein